MDLATAGLGYLSGINGLITMYRMNPSNHYRGGLHKH